jgi:hypothetical protein
MMIIISPHCRSDHTAALPHCSTTARCHTLPRTLPQCRTLPHALPNTAVCTAAHCRVHCRTLPCAHLHSAARARPCTPPYSSATAASSATLSYMTACTARIKFEYKQTPSARCSQIAPPLLLLVSFPDMTQPGPRILESGATVRFAPHLLHEFASVSDYLSTPSLLPFALICSKSELVWLVRAKPPPPPLDPWEKGGSHSAKPKLPCVYL